MFTFKAIEDGKKGGKKDALDVLLNDTLMYEHVSAIEDALDDSPTHLGTPTSEV